MVLAREKCVACRRDSVKVTEEELTELYQVIPDWHLVDEEGVMRLARTFRFHDFAEALDFGVKIGEISEDAGHHPCLTVEWGRINVEWWTHKIKGLHRNDFIMAAKTDEIFSSFR